MNFPGNRAQILGGMFPVFLHWSEKEWPITFLRMIGGSPLCDTMDFPEERFIGYSLQNRLRFAEQFRLTASGILYSYSLTGVVKFSLPMEDTLNYLKSRRHYVACADHLQQARLLGVPGNLCRFEWDFDSEEEPEESPLLRYRIFWESRQAAPFINILLCDYAVPASPFESYTLEGYWNPGYITP
jgi:hypothetical protein